MSSIGLCTLPLGPHLVLLFGESMEPLGWGVLQEVGHWGCALKFYSLVSVPVLFYSKSTVQCDQPAFPLLQQGLSHHNGLYDFWDCKGLVHCPAPSFQRCIASSFSVLVALSCVLAAPNWSYQGSRFLSVTSAYSSSPYLPDNLQQQAS